MEQIFIVENIKCSGCVNSIKDALLKIKNITHVEVNIEKELITINGDVDKDAVVNKLTLMGYPEKGNNDLIKKTKSYISCAIGKMK
ncbi:MAG: heavy-metal-associated domain-containing protein [Bacteroidetes bacterium]|nr:heavy-metal-associated domain-containing protein [Bacteroidota bacterium]